MSKQTTHPVAFLSPQGVDVWMIEGWGACMRPEKGYASVCGCTACLGVYAVGGDKSSSGSSL